MIPSLDKLLSSPDGGVTCQGFEGGWVTRNKRGVSSNQVLRSCGIRLKVEAVASS